MGYNGAMTSIETENLIGQLHQNVGGVVLGQDEVVRLTTVALLAGEHLLLEDVPGVGKTLVGKAMARSVAGTFHRIQFTPDLLPADITGSSLYNGKTQEFSFSRGPVFANVVLADEINRATPRTQSALLEAMSERQVSVDGQTHPLPRPFMVIGTQNPVEFEGTYPLPESQLDRFLLRIPLGYPAREVELEVLSSHRLGEPVDTLQPRAQLRADRGFAGGGAAGGGRGFGQRLPAGHRPGHPRLRGVARRREHPGALALYRAAQAAALVAGRGYVVPDDVKSLAVPVLAHRVITKGYLHGDQREAVEALIERLVEDVPVPA